jgi:hypothetical protein
MCVQSSPGSQLMTPSAQLPSMDLFWISNKQVLLKRLSGKSPNSMISPQMEKPAFTSRWLHGILKDRRVLARQRITRST